MSVRERFEIQKELGEGGFARVFLAREKTTQRKVALKVLKDAYLKDSEVVERFRREVFAVASISSPHVVGMHDFGISGDEVYIAMEFVEGQTLRELIYERTWTAQEIHLVVGQIAQALAAAHRQDIVHRDLKPENVILVPTPNNSRQVKVLDFGLAKLAELERKLGLEPLTRAGMCFGTPQYMAPELIRGKPFDKSVDLYALGVMTFEMIAGVLPWDGIDPREVLISVVKNPPPHLVHAHPSIERLPLVDKFVQRVLSKNPSDRPKDAGSFFREFEQVLLGDKAPKKKSAGVPAEDAAFATVWAATFELSRGDDATEIDMGQRVHTPESTRVEATRPGERSKRRLASGWMPSVGEVSGDTDTEEDLKQAAARVLASSPSTKSPHDDERADTMERPAVAKRPLAAVAVESAKSAVASAPSPLASGPGEAKPSTTAKPQAETKPSAQLTSSKQLYGFTSRPDHTQMVKAPSRRAMLWWLVPLLLGLVVFAAAVGYVVGRAR